MCSHIKHEKDVAICSAIACYRIASRVQLIHSIVHSGHCFCLRSKNKSNMDRRVDLQ